MEEAGRRDALDAYLPESVRAWLEERFWRPIEAQATLEALCGDPDFVASPGTHPGMFADHGVVHVRDVATGLVHLMETVDGVLLPRRSPARRAFVETLGVALAYIHDIGMVDMSAAGRRTHALFAAHAAFRQDLTPLVTYLLRPGPVRDRLDGIAVVAPFVTALDVVVREMLATAVAHSKTAVPAPVLDDRAGFRRLLKRVVFTPLAQHREAPCLPSAVEDSLVRYHTNVDAYADPTTAFAWLDATAGPQAALADDVIDAVRILRAADVMRQRGSVLRTSGGFEVSIDAATARCVSTMRPADGRAAYVVVYDNDRAAGEANIRVAFVTLQGDLRIAFHRGAFGSPEAAQRAASCVADVVLDIVADVIPSLGGMRRGDGLEGASRLISDVMVQLERPGDRPEFAAEVAALVTTREASLGGRVFTVANVEGAAAAERRRYHRAEPVDGAEQAADELLRRLAEHGADTTGIDRATAFAEVRRTTVRAGEVVVSRGSAPSFVYVPVTPGLVVRPAGGYAAAPLHPWVPLGTTGVIRRAERNADIVAEREVTVLIIPGEVYAAAWLRPLRAEELPGRLRSWPATA